MNVRFGKAGGKAVLAILSLIFSYCSMAKQYPDRPINLVVPYNAGAAVDTVGRILAQALAENLAVPVVVENKAGFTGNIGAQYVARSKADGYTLLMAALSSYSLSGKLLGEKAVGYNLVKDFEPVAVVGKLPVSLIANKDLPASNVSELIAYLHKNPAKVAFGSSGPGSLEHAVGELFKLRAKVDILHVPYRGAAPAMTDLLSNQIQLLFATTPITLANVPSGKIKVLGIAGDAKIPQLADVETLAHQGLSGVEATSLFGILVPKDTPDNIVEKLNSGLQKALSDPEVIKKFSQQGVTATLGNRAQAKDMVEAEITKWNQIINDTNLKISN